MTLHQPWATLISMGVKSIETRSWPTNYHGPLAIHASVKWDRRLKDATRSAWQTLLDRGIDALACDPPRGLIVAVVNLYWVARMPEGSETADDLQGVPIAELDRIFGDLSPGRYAWFLKDIRPIDTMVHWTGKQGLKDVPTPLAAKLEALAESDGERRRDYSAKVGFTP